MNGIDSSISNLVAAQRGSLNTTIGYAVAAKQLDALEQQGTAVQQLLTSAVQLSAQGTGHQIDRHA